MFDELLALKGVEGYRSGDVPPEEWLHICFEDGGLGDHVARLPALAYILKHYPQIHLTVWAPKFFIPFGRRALPSIVWNEYSKNMIGPASRPPIYAGNSKPPSGLGMHLVDQAFVKIVDRLPTIEHKNYLKVTPIDVSHFNLPKKYVVITTGHTVKVREFKASVVNDIAKFVKASGYEVVWLGSKEATTGVKGNILGNFSNEVDYSVGLDLIGSTDLLEAHAVIARATAIVGVDNGLLHVAGCTETSIVAGYTTVESIHRLPYRHNELGWKCFVVEPPKSLACRFCQSNMNFLYDFDFRNCRYKDVKCVTEQTAESYINHLGKLLW